MRIKFIFFLFAAPVFCLACTSGGSIKLNELEYPVSMSAYLYDENAGLVSAGKGLEVLKSFIFSKTFYGTLADISNDKEITANIQKHIKEANGSGVINLHFVIANNNDSRCCVPYIPRWPGRRTEVTVIGDIVRYTK
jgi:hypothetical protein